MKVVIIITETDHYIREGVSERWREKEREGEREREREREREKKLGLSMHG